ncbi:hypothetical protein [Trichlorobacter lovleyi]|uniref:hypothetical protein n=1 Tax=Trichlorobacter lovleyi TaxID=313985 RepID=UPI002480F49E|nr:hypothetical protein [Trichlorobacter lovleyi]
MSSILQKLKDMKRWLAEMKYAWISLGVVLVALCAAVRPSSTEPQIRIIGLILQLLGIWTVIWGISETRAFFGHPTFIQKAKEWLVKCPLIKRKITSISGSCNISLVAGGSATAFFVHGAGENPTLESRIQTAEKNILAIHERISQTQNSIEAEARNASSALQKEAQLRQAEDSILHTKLEVTGTGGVHISAIGATWLFVGVMLSTASVEISKLLKCIYNT